MTNGRNFKSMFTPTTRSFLLDTKGQVVEIKLEEIDTLIADLKYTQSSIRELQKVEETKKKILEPFNGKYQEPDNS